MIFLNGANRLVPVAEKYYVSVRYELDLCILFIRN
jgi:hypothetical protein